MSPKKSLRSGAACLRRILVCLAFLSFSSCASRARTTQAGTETTATFRWVHANTDPQLWEQILQKFNEELTPDQPTPEKDGTHVYTCKFLKMVGVFGHSALVIVGHRPSKEVTKDNAWNVAYSAFNFDLTTGRKSSTEHAEWLWQWKFIKLAKFGPTSAPDVTFTYLSCTECEPDFMFSSFYYDEEKYEWRMRPWGDGKDLWWTANDGLVVELDLIGDGDLTFFDCVYGILSSQDTGFQNLAMRCKEFTETASGESKVADNTVLYSMSNGQFKARRVTDTSEAVRLTQQICKPGMKSFLCRLPADTSITAGQAETLKTVFPKAPATAHDLVNFRSLNPRMTMLEVVSRCGLPDELSGSGVYVFTYHLRDGSFVHISAKSTDSPILEAYVLDAEGRGSSLFAAK
jgi:hypothetical protein